MQNAHDASIASDKKLIASIRDNSEELVFLHNGSDFTIAQIQRLVFHGSTKVEDEETIGRYGSGFLTTHLLSWDIDVSGQLEDGQWFDFCLSRNPESVDALSTSMNQAWDDFKPVSSLREPMPESFTTRFKYPITEIWAKNAVKEGNTTLKQCAPFVVVFNKAFYSIDIKEPPETRSFVVQRRLSIRSRLSEINVIQNINETQEEMKYLLAQGKKSSVAVHLSSLELKFLIEDPASNKLMEIIGVQQSDLRLEFIAEDKEKRDEVINVATTLYDSPQLVQHMQNNEATLFYTSRVQLKSVSSAIQTTFLRILILTINQRHSIVGVGLEG